MKKIGFIDYYLAEWHADNYPAWIKSANEALSEDFCLCYAWGEIPSPKGITSEQWCLKNGVTLCKSIEEVCEKSDFLFILAPSDPEKHLGYAEKVLSYKKPTYIDKTFAPDLKTAEKIFAIAEKYATPFFSTSALRYATELDDIIGSEAAIVTGGGRSIEEYCIHQIEMLVKTLDLKPESVKVERQGEKQYLVSVKFEGGKVGSFVYSDALPFTICAEKEGASRYLPINSDYFGLLIKDILKLIKNKKVPFDTKQTIYVMAVREKTVEGVNNPDKWLKIEY